MNDRLSYRLPDAAKALGVSLRTIERAIAQDRMRSIKLGAVRTIPAAEVERVAAEGFPPLDARPDKAAPRKDGRGRPRKVR